MSCQNHNLPRNDQMFYLPDREIAERSPDSLVGSRRRGGIHRGPPGRSVLPNPKTPTRVPETCFFQAMKIVHFSPDLAVRILGRICSEKVVNPGICYEALQLMTLRNQFCRRNPRPSIGGIP